MILNDVLEIDQPIVLQLVISHQKVSVKGSMVNSTVERVV